MTKEEAIQVLQAALTAPFIYGEYADAISMAIEALSAETHEISTETHGVCSDLIRRDVDGTLVIRVPNAKDVGRVLVLDANSHIGGGLYYPEQDDDRPKGDLISRQWLLEVYGDYIGDNGEPKYHVPLEVVRQNIKDAPSAEAVEVVRCKDCRFFKKIVERSDSGICHRDIVASAWKENGYCSRGERKGGDNNETD